MAKYELTLAAATWTDLSATVVAAVGKKLVVSTKQSDFKIGMKATAPTDGIALVANEGVEVNIKQGDTLKLWAYSTAGGKIYAEGAGAKQIVWDGTGTT